MKRETILVIEDEPDILEVIEYNLAREGYRVKTAREGDEGLQRARRDSPDLVLLDIMLPRRSGLEVCREIRADASLAGTRVLMLTAKGGQRDHERGLEAGADDYVTKPFSTQDLVARAQALLADPVLRLAPGAAARGTP